jgi:hypothetical protein
MRVLRPVPGAFSPMPAAIAKEASAAAHYDDTLINAKKPNTH